MASDPQKPNPSKQPGATEQDMMAPSNPYLSTSNAHEAATNSTTTTAVPSESTASTPSPQGPDPSTPDTPPTYQFEIPSDQGTTPATVPLYTETATESLTETLTSMRKQAEELGLSSPDLITLPLTKSPQTIPQDQTPEATKSWNLSRNIINAFYRAIRSKKDDLVTLFVQQGLISPDCPNGWGETPLIAAVASGNGQMVCTLLNIGADVNLMGRYDARQQELQDLLLLNHNNDGTGLGLGLGLGHISTANTTNAWHHLDGEILSHAGAGIYPVPLRTPLMVAASRGNLALVKLLMEDFHADDSIIAPDGQLALRLAVESSPDGPHREIVAYLPSRRGGAWRRWKTHHQVAVRRIKKAGHNLYEFIKFFVWDVPRFFLWSVPKHVIVLPIYKGTKWAWENKSKFGGWCKRQVKALPGRVKRGTQKIGRGIKAVGRSIKEIPGILAKFGKWIWRVIKSIPSFMKIIGSWIWECLKKIGIAVGSAFLKVISAIHTAFMAVLNFFGRITLKDVWDGFVQVIRAIFVELPVAIWSGLKSFGGVSYKALKKLFGWVGAAIWYFFVGLFWLLLFIPKQFWKMLVAIGSSIAKGYHEIMVWFNPKH